MDSIIEVQEHFKDPKNREKALLFMKDHIECFHYLCCALSQYIKKNINDNVSVSCYLCDPLCISKLIPEIKHITELGYKEEPFWTQALCNTYGVSNVYKARTMHIDAALKLLKK